jgi:hypothetical protein
MLAGWLATTSAHILTPGVIQSPAAGVSLWPYTDSLANVQMGRNLTIWLHTLPSFASDTTKVMCAQKVNLVMSFETYRQCTNLTAGVQYQYVTIQRFTTIAGSLALMEARVYRPCEGHHFLTSCCRLIDCAGLHVAVAAGHPPPSV